MEDNEDHSRNQEESNNQDEEAFQKITGHRHPRIGNFRADLSFLSGRPLLYF
jgi:hypothetical protein